MNKQNKTIKMRVPLLVLLSSIFCLASTVHGSSESSSDQTPPSKKVLVCALKAAGFDYVVGNREDAPLIGSSSSNANNNVFTNFVGNYTHEKVGAKEPTGCINMQHFSPIYTFDNNNRPVAGHTDFQAEIQRYFQENLNQEAIAQHFVLWYLLGFALLDGADMLLQVDHDGRINVMQKLHQGYFGWNRDDNNQQINVQQQFKRPHVLHGLPSKAVKEMGWFIEKNKAKLSALKDLFPYEMQAGFKQRLEELGSYSQYWEKYSPFDIFILMCVRNNIKSFHEDYLGILKSDGTREISQARRDFQPENWYNHSRPSIFSCFADTLIMSTLAQGNTVDAAALKDSLCLVNENHPANIENYSNDEIISSYTRLIEHLKSQNSDREAARLLNAVGRDRIKLQAASGSHS